MASRPSCHTTSSSLFLQKKMLVVFWRNKEADWPCSTLTEAHYFIRKNANCFLKEWQTCWQLPRAATAEIPLPRTSSCLKKLLALITTHDSSTLQDRRLIFFWRNNEVLWQLPSAIFVRLLLTRAVSQFLQTKMLLLLAQQHPPRMTTPLRSLGALRRLWKNQAPDYCWKQLPLSS